MGSTVPERPSVTIAQGTYKGKVLVDSNQPVRIEAWLGIRYAKPPVRELRLARPIALPKSDEIFDATEYGFRCPGKQLLQIPGLPRPSEDCLTLNVFRQKRESAEGKGGRLLPVLLYIHGGAFNRGTAAMHDTATMLSHSAAPFLAISCNYRLGAFGFLNSALTAREGVLNLGLHDQRLVLEWIQENATAFGGDPGNVTVMGLSAGAHSIGHHIMNINETRRLFHRAILESGGATSRAVHPFDSGLHEKQSRELLTALKCPQSLPEDEVMDLLRSVPERQFIDAQIKVFDAYNPSLRWAWQPVIDDEIISRRPLDGWKSGHWHKIPILTGFNHNEGTMYVSKEMTEGQQFRQFFATLLPQLSGEDLDELERLYPDPVEDPNPLYVESRDPKYGLGAQYRRVEAAYGQYAYVAPVRQTASFGGCAESDQARVYIYHWATQSSTVAGANHGDQLWYECMDRKVRGTSPTQAKIAQEFHDYICSFIVSGDPNVIGGSSSQRPEWRAFDDGGGTMVFGQDNDERAGGTNAGIASQLVADSWAERETGFWWEKSEQHED